MLKQTGPPALANKPGWSCLGALLILLLVIPLPMIAAQRPPSDDCSATYPHPVIKYDHTDAEGRIYIPVENWSVYPSSIFRKAPELPPCGLNKSSSRTWVNIYNAENNAEIYGFCAFTTNADLKAIWFKPAVPNGRVYIIINDRACKKTYKSNVLAYGECVGNHPNPVIKYDHTDAEGRIYIPVENGSTYPTLCSAALPRFLPAERTRTLHAPGSISTMPITARIYGFCAFTANTDLKSIWFMPPTPN